MDRQHDEFSAISSSILRLLETTHTAPISRAELATLAEEIATYVLRSRRPPAQAIPLITKNYLTDGKRVKDLLHGRDEASWQDVLGQVIKFATAHPYYPQPEEATSSPDLEAYTDIRRSLPSYNFEGTLDSWIAATVVRRLTRFWRDRQALRVGGNGFQDRQTREAQRLAGVVTTSPRKNERSLEGLTIAGTPYADELAANQPETASVVEEREMYRLVDMVLEQYAAEQLDPRLSSMWRESVHDEHKLREIAARHGLTIGQVNHRLSQIRGALQQDPRVRQWFDRAGEGL